MEDQWFVEKRGNETQKRLERKSVKNLGQTILFSAYLSPEFYSLRLFQRCLYLLHQQRSHGYMHLLHFSPTTTNHLLPSLARGDHLLTFSNIFF